MSQQHRLQAIDPAHAYIVQAPAGSGKTELLTQRILTLLNIVGEPEEILALTFTRKAAAEMRHRVMSALQFAATQTAPVDQQSHRWQTWQLATQVLKRSQQFDWHLLEHPNRLQIMTIDSLASMLARQLPLLSGLGQMPKPSDDARTSYLLAAEHVLQKSIQQHINAAETLLLHQDHQAVAVIEMIADLLENREQWLPELARHGRNLQGLRHMLEKNLAVWINHQLQQCDALIPINGKSEILELAQFTAEQLKQTTSNEEDAPMTWPQAEVSDLAAWQYLAVFLVTADGHFKKRIDKRHGFPLEAKAEKQRMKHLLETLANIPNLAALLHKIAQFPTQARYHDEQWQVIEALFELLPLAVAELQQSFNSQGNTDFTEISLRALHALHDELGRPSDVLLRMDYRIQHILLDEFQDTSELQMRLLRCLTSGWQDDDGRTLFMVGDPMQSIYRFRKAEVALFLNTINNSSELPAVDFLPLERNFRSSSVIVEWVNRAFAHIFPSLQQQDPLSGAIAHAPAIAALNHIGNVTLHLQQPDKEQNDSKTTTEIQEALHIVGLVQQAIASNMRVGILAKTRKHLHQIMVALNEAAIPMRAINILPLAAQAEIQAMRALLRALLHPADDVAWLSLLRAVYCGIGHRDLFKLLRQRQKAQTIWQLLQEPNAFTQLTDDAAQRLSFLLQALTPCMQTAGRIAVRTLLESAWQRLSMSALFDVTAHKNVQTLLELVDSLDTGGQIDLSLLDQRIEQLYAAPDASPESAQVELMTMHGAKGLEWDVVILPGLARGGSHAKQRLLNFTELPLYDGLLLMSAKAPVRDQDAIYQLIQTVEKEKEQHELARLLYVACTRAKQSLHLFGTLDTKGKARKGSLLELLWDDSDGQCFGAEIAMLDESVQTTQESNPSSVLQRVKQPPSIALIPMQENAEEPEYGWAGPEAAPIGNALHAVLQNIADIGIENWQDKHHQQAIEDMSSLLIGEGLSGKLLQSAIQRCQQGLDKTLKSSMGQWILSNQHRQAHCEWALLSHKDGQLSERIIDRSFIDEHGVRWIIDYKTGSHEGANLNHFIENEAARYSAQLKAYAQLLQQVDPHHPIKTALYFPLLDAWYEYPGF